MTKSKKKVNLYFFPDGTFQMMFWSKVGWIKAFGTYGHDIEGECYATYIDECGRCHDFEEVPTFAALRLKLRRFFTRRYAEEIV